MGKRNKKKVQNKELFKFEGSKEHLLWFDHMESITEKPKADFYTDLDILRRIIDDCTDIKYKKEFWNYFKEKYSFKAIDEQKYFADISDTLRQFFISCIIPFNLKLDIKYPGDKYGKLSLLHSIGWWFRFRIVYLITNSIIIVLFILALSLSLYYKDINPWLSGFFSDFIMGIVMAWFITSLNWIYRDARNSLTNSINNIIDRTKEFQKRINKQINIFVNGRNILNYCDIDNTIHWYIKSVKKRLGIKMSRNFIRLIDIEKRMYNCAHDILRSGQDNTINLTPSDKGLTMMSNDVQELKIILAEYNYDIQDITYKYSKQINKIERKEL
jgi:hypothetical protein